MKKIIMFLLINLVLINLVFAQQNCSEGNCDIIKNLSNKEEANCTEQLEILLNEYNNLTEDYYSGINCGIIRFLLVENNEKLSNNLKECNEKVGGYKPYKLGFYFLFIVDFLAAIYLFYNSIINNRRKKNG